MMNDFLRRVGNTLNAEEFSKYTELLEPSPLIRVQLKLLEERFDDLLDEEVREKVIQNLPEIVKDAIAEKLEDIADELDKLEEAILGELKYLPYDQLVTRVEQLFETFNQTQNLRGD